MIVVGIRLEFLLLALTDAELGRETRVKTGKVPGETGIPRYLKKQTNKKVTGRRIFRDFLS